MSANRRVLLAVVLLPLLAGCSRENERATAGAAYADSVAAAYGGWEAWKAIHYVRFDRSLRVENKPLPQNRARHLWDLTSGECRFESDLAALGDFPQKAKITAIVNRVTGTGRVFVERDAADTAPLPPEKTLLELARARIEEDGTALLFPFLLRDAGTTLEDLGPATTPRDARPAREIRVRRKGAPEVRMFLDPESHKILETSNVPGKGEAAVALLWRSEVNVGGVRLVAERQESEARTRIFDLLAAPDHVNPDVFADFARRMPY